METSTLLKEESDSTLEMLPFGKSCRSLLFLCIFWKNKPEISPREVSARTFIGSIGQHSSNHSQVPGQTKSEIKFSWSLYLNNI